ncbi:MAG: hypothetical protein A3F91_09545 [Flavobacteria bacterium RIFCSPLOWO2_12_FULL_35_11]|nr:MAG: hypothetical protein A3F91_09545 [Flavobacteria bacterium RIFCSPLOWO2_12_FULL_35_11]
MAKEVDNKLTTNMSGSTIATEDNWEKINGEFAFSENKTGCVNDDGTVFFDSKGFSQYMFKNKEDAYRFLFNGENVSHKYSFCVGFHYDNPRLDEQCEHYAWSVWRDVECAEAEKQIGSGDEKINAQLRDMAKISALGTYLSSDINNSDDYEKFMKFETLNGTDIDIWEPFENHSLEEIQELVEQEFSATLHSYMKVAEIVKSAVELESLATGAHSASADEVAENVRKLADSSTQSTSLSQG